MPLCMLEAPLPDNLLTVPSCRSCNEGFSKDEQYLLAVISQVGFVPALQAKVAEGGKVDRMLARDSRLDGEVNSELVIASSGKGVMYQPEQGRLQRITQKVGFGLYLTRYEPKRQPPLADFKSSPLFHSHDPQNWLLVMSHTERFQSRRWKVLQHGVFAYMFVKDWAEPDAGRLFCVFKMYETLWGAVRCPNANAGGRRTRTTRAPRPTLT